MRFGAELGLGRLAHFFNKIILHTQTTQNWVNLYLHQLTFGCLFLHFDPFWSSLDNTMAVELRFGKPSVDYQKLIFCAAAFMAAR